MKDKNEQSAAELAMLEDVHIAAELGSLREQGSTEKSILVQLRRYYKGHRFVLRTASMVQPALALTAVTVETLPNMQLVVWCGKEIGNPLPRRPLVEYLLNARGRARTVYVVLPADDDQPEARIHVFYQRAEYLPVKLEDGERCAYAALEGFCLHGCVYEHTENQKLVVKVDD